MRAGLFWCIAVPFLLIISSVVFQLMELTESRALYVERARLNAQNLGATLAASIAGSFQIIDVTLQAAKDQLQLRHWPAQVYDPQLETSLEQMRGRAPSLIALRVVNADGDIVYGRDPGQLGKVNVADRPYFHDLVDNPRAGMLISEPLFSRVAKRWVLICARRLELPDGRFGGVVTGVIALESMAERLSGKEIKLGDNDVFALRDSQSNLLTRYGHGRQNMEVIGSKLASPALVALQASGITSGFYESESGVDNVDRISYYQKVAGQPLSVVVGLSTDDALAGWRRESQHAWLGIGLFAVLVVGGAVLFYRAQMRKLDAVHELEDAHVFNEEIIDHSPIGINVYRPNGQCVLTNPSMLEIVGATAEQLLAQNFREIQAWKDCGALEMADQTLADDQTRQMRAPVTTAFGKKNIWLQWVFTTFMSRGEKQLLVMARDVTEVTLARAALEESNSRFRMLSVTDALTGIANRRSFNETLEAEWRRAARNRQPLALAMIDVDLFKKYNDHYGHQGGDECLRSVAQVLEKNCRRAGDFLARYGGEEFALVSPATDSAGIARVAENMRRELELLALPHALSPYGCVTVSIGVASMIPEEAQQPEVLIAKADKALYDAKAGGRNRVAVNAETIAEQ
ncbi:MAG: diguanylate cyclase [Burkholderiaceae bacterium]|nr:diguanylate cyclase [Burkholderiaceae bacterium]